MIKGIVGESIWFSVGRRSNGDRAIYLNGEIFWLSSEEFEGLLTTEVAR